jgi:hypothetical protein
MPIGCWKKSAMRTDGGTGGTARATPITASRSAAICGGSSPHICRAAKTDGLAFDSICAGGDCEVELSAKAEASQVECRACHAAEVTHGIQRVAQVKRVVSGRADSTCCVVSLRAHDTTAAQAELCCCTGAHIVE